jgi:hypothetical protein
MNSRHITPPAAVLIAVTALVVGLEAPAVAHQVNVAAHKISGSTLKPNSVTGKQIKESTLGVVPKAKTIPALKWHKLTLINSWVSVTPSRPASYAIDAQGLVHFKGEIEDGTAFSESFILPTPAAPTATLNFPVYAGAGGLGSLDVEDNGHVVPASASGAVESGHGVVLDGVV